MNRNLLLAIGIGATAASTFLWHGPGGAGDRLASRAEIVARRTLDYYDLPGVQAKMERAPLRRRLILSGAANEFQRTELVRILDNIPGVIEVRWDPASPQIPYEASR